MLSLEAFIGTNLMMNLLILGVTARCVGHVRWGRLLLAALLGTGYAAAVYAVGWGWLKCIGMQLIFLICMARIALGRRHGRSWRGYARVLGGVIFSGGVMTLLSRWLAPGGVLLTAAGWVCIAAAVVLSGERQEVGRTKYVLLRISTRMGSAEIEAMVDTGNRLREPLSGLPVLIVGSRLLEEVLDVSSLQRTVGRLPPGFRRVRYSVLGGTGDMVCFRPASVCAWNGEEWVEAPAVWVGIYPDELPSSIEALAPPVFL